MVCFKTRFMVKRYSLLILLLFLISLNSFANDGYKLWLQYDIVKNKALRKHYQSHIKKVMPLGHSKTIKIALNELERGLSGMLGESFLSKVNKSTTNKCVLVFGSKASLNQDVLNLLEKDFREINDEGFIIKSISLKGKKQIIITGKTDVGVLYGVFNFLRLIQTNKFIKNLSIIDAPKLQRYIDYARANASIGINGTVLNNVNANALILTPQYLEKVKALANVFKSYGIKVYLTARFSAPIEIGGLKS